MRNLITKYLGKSESVLYWLTATLLIWIPLYQKFPLIRIENAFAAIRLEDILIFISFVVLTGHLFLSGKYKLLIKDRLFIAISGFLFIGFVSFVVNALVANTILAKVGLLHFLRRFEFMGLFYVGYYSLSSKNDLKFFMRIILLVFVVVVLYGLGQKYFGFPSVVTINSELSKGAVRYLNKEDRINSTFAGHYDLAVYLVMFLVATLPLIYRDMAKLKWKNLIFPVLAWIGGFFVLLTSAARTSFLAFVVGFASTFLVLKKWKIILIGMFAFALVLSFPTQLRNRLISTISINLKRDWSSFQAKNESQGKRSLLNIPTLPYAVDNPDETNRLYSDIVPGEPTDLTDVAVYRSFDIRVNVEWPRAIKAFIKNPLIGSGYSSLGLATDNDILRALGEVGLLGTYLFILILYLLFRKYLKIIKTRSGFDKYLAIGLLTMLMAFIINSLLIDVFEASKIASYFWLVNGIIFSYYDHA